MCIHSVVIPLPLSSSPPPPHPPPARNLRGWYVTSTTNRHPFPTPPTLLAVSTSIRIEVSVSAVSEPVFMEVTHTVSNFFCTASSSLVSTVDTARVYLAVVLGRFAVGGVGTDGW